MTLVKIADYSKHSGISVYSLRKMMYSGEIETIKIKGKLFVDKEEADLKIKMQKVPVIKNLEQFLAERRKKN